jgi:hypothetical protein
MPFNSAGVYTPASGATTATPGAIIASATWNSIHSDFSAALTLLGQQLYNQTSVNHAASPYTPLATDALLLVDTTGGSVTINLPAASARNGYPLTIKDAKGSANSNTITINRNGTDTIDGLTVVTISDNYSGYELTPITGGWIIGP